MIYSNSHFDKLFNNLFSQPTYSSSAIRFAEKEPYEINHTKDGAYLFFDVPGFNNSNLKVEIENGVLYIEGKRTYKLNGEDAEKVVSQKFKIGDDYNPDNIEATIEDGLLTVFVPNYKKTDRKKRISLL